MATHVVLLNEINLSDPNTKNIPFQESQPTPSRNPEHRWGKTFLEMVLICWVFGSTSWMLFGNTKRFVSVIQFVLGY